MKGHGILMAAILPCLLLPCGCSDDGTSPSGDKLPAEYRLLRSADMFEGAAVGFGGTTPEVVLAFRKILAHPQGDLYFKRLLDEATLPGRLYGLAGVYFTDQEALAELAPPYLDSNAQVQTFFGCIMGPLSVAELAGRIVDGTLCAELRGS
jgi:hypothetical protein